MVIEICETNETRMWIPDIRAMLPDAEIVVYSCLDHCNACYLTFFTYVDGELLEAYTPQHLLQKLKHIADSTPP
ncbi:DUF1450 domain-containing protein [Effusibacillus dendaii]|uniref:DUF1450 domain-containing protein n=1 Tax=Effusibacillus dendaii TaxID=2743772 RepID=A0A7I8DCV0_9BACL|nr:DUF1450 domain-containing protein [Effusibacillus dendaii]BCJ86656.1 hypothetical protein skT53_16410 [Effusibacillus dendaii]